MDIELPLDIQSDQEMLKMVLVGKFENYQQIVKVLLMSYSKKMI